MTPPDMPVGGEGSERAERFTSVFVSTLRSRGWREAQPLIEQHWHEFALTKPGVLLDAIKLLPSEVFIENPTLLVSVDRLKHALAGTAPHSKRPATDPSAAVPTRAPDLKKHLIAATGRIVSSRAEGRLPEAVADAAEAHRALREAASDALAPLKSTLPHLTIQWSRAMDVGDHPAAIELYEDTYETALLFEQPRVARRAAASLAWMYAEQGHTHEARNWLDRGLAIDVPAESHDAPLFLAAALLAADALDCDEARSQLATASQFPPDEYWAASLWVRSILCGSSDDRAQVARDLAHEVRLHPGDLASSGANLRYLELARWALNEPRVDAVVDAAAAAESTVAHDLIASELAYRQGSFAEAMRRAMPLHAESTAPRFRTAALLITAASRFRLGRTNSGVEAFRQAHALAEHEDLLLIFSLIDRTDLLELARLSTRKLRPAVISVIYPLRTERQPIPSLSQRERQVLGLLATELTNAEIAERLFVTTNTLKSTLRNVYRKLGVHDRRSASEVARMLGIDRYEE